MQPVEVIESKKGIYETRGEGVAREYTCVVDVGAWVKCVNRNLLTRGVVRFFLVNVAVMWSSILTWNRIKRSAG